MSNNNTNNRQRNGSSPSPVPFTDGGDINNRNMGDQGVATAEGAESLKERGAPIGNPP